MQLGSAMQLQLSWHGSQMNFVTLGPVLGVALQLVLDTAPRPGAAGARSGHHQLGLGVALWLGLHG